MSEVFDDVQFVYQKDVEEPPMIVIRCSNCGEKLIELFTCGDGPTSQLVAECPFCGDKSFRAKVDGAFKFAASQGVEIVDVRYDDVIIFKTQKGD